jgi:hypothetical protein
MATDGQATGIQGGTAQAALRKKSAKAGLHFLFTEHDGRLFRPTRCWIKPEKGGLDSWSLALSRPVGAEGSPLITDLKAWVLFGDREKRFFQFTDPTEARPMRAYQRQEVLKRYVRAVVQSLPEKNQQGPFWLLMPSIADEERRKRYLEALEQAIPGAYILPEPEMVIEYFRLVRRELTLERDRTGIFLVIDVGASTCNFTFVLTTKSGKVVESKDGRQRTVRLRAARGDATKFGGRWVDLEIANLLNVDLQQFDRPIRDDVIAAIERAKIAVAESGSDAVVEHAMLPYGPMLNTEHLQLLSQELWTQLRPTYLGVAAALLEQLQATEYAREQFGSLLQERGVSAPQDVERILDAVLLAGGTSQLPGFEQAMRESILPNVELPRILRVGREYPVAAAVGALAHVLHQHHEPSRLRVPKTSTSNLAQSEFQGALPSDIYLGWKRKGDHQATYTRVMDRYDSFADQDGERPIAGLPAYEAGSELAARLLPSRDNAQVQRIGLKPRDLRVRRAPGEMKLVWNAADREARIASTDVTGTGGLFLSLSRLGVLAPTLPTTSMEDADQDSLLSLGAPDVVIDIGMSKTVAVTAEDGAINVEQLASMRPAPAAAHYAIASSQPALDVVDAAHDLAAAPIDVPREKAPATPPTSAIPPPAPDHEEVRAAVPPLSDGARDDEASLREDSVASFGSRLELSLTETRDLGIKDVRSDVAMLLLALAVRPFVMLAGPPGSGKSSLVRIAAGLLGTTSDESYCEVDVQPHWQTDAELPPSARVPFESGEPPLRLFLFDEFNLARPERYLMRFFRELEMIHQARSSPRVLACATLNIDDSSRPPSPKIMDRCFLIEIDAPMSTAPTGIGLRPSAIDTRPIGALPHAPPPDQQRPRAWQPIDDLLRVIQDCVRTKNLRHDLLPSRRGLIDMAAIVGLHAQGSFSPALLSEEELIDRVIAGRILAKISGAAEQVEPVVDALYRHLEQTPYTRCLRRLELARSQLQLGFVSPWQ